MEYSQDSDPTAKHLLRFRGDEVEVIQALYLEDATLSERNGNTDENFIAHEFAQVDKLPEEYTIRLSSPSKFVERLEDFNGRTDKQVFELAQPEVGPAYRNKDAILRRFLGKQALALAEEIREKLQLRQEEDDQEAVVQEQYAELMRDLGEISGLDLRDIDE